MKKNKKLLSILLCTSALGVAGILSHSVQAAEGAGSPKTVAQAPVTQIKVKVIGGLTTDQKVASATEIYFNLPADVNKSNYSAVSDFLNQKFTASKLNLKLRVANFQKIDGGYAINLFGADRGKFDQIVKLNQKGKEVAVPQSVTEVNQTPEVVAATKKKLATVQLSVKNRSWKYYLLMTLNPNDGIDEVKRELNKHGIKGVRLQLDGSESKSGHEVYVASQLYGGASIKAFDQALARGKLVESRAKRDEFRNKMNFEVISGIGQNKKTKTITLNVPREIDRRRLTTKQFYDQLREYFTARYFYDQEGIQPSNINFEWSKEETKVILSGRAAESFDQINDDNDDYVHFSSNHEIVETGQNLGSGSEADVYLAKTTLGTLIPSTVVRLPKETKKEETEKAKPGWIGAFKERLRTLRADEDKLRADEDKLIADEKELKIDEERLGVSEEKSDQKRNEIAQEKDRIAQEEARIAQEKARIAQEKARIAQEKARIAQERVAIKNDVEARANQRLMLEKLFVQHNPAIMNERSVLAKKVPKQKPAKKRKPAPTAENASKDNQKQAPPVEAKFATLMREGEFDAQMFFIDEIEESVILTSEMLLDLFSGLKTISEANLVHLDIKPANLMFIRDQKGHLRLCYIDFSYVHQQGELLGGNLGTPLYMAPEMTRGNAKVTSKMDIYSLGTSIISMLLRDQYYIADGIDLTKGAIELGRDRIKKDGKAVANQAKAIEQLRAQHVNKTLVDLLEKMVAFDPSDRPDPKECFARAYGIKSIYENEMMVNSATTVINADGSKKVQYSITDNNSKVHEFTEDYTISDLVRKIENRKGYDQLDDIQSVMIMNGDGSVDQEFKSSDFSNTDLKLKLQQGQKIIVIYQDTPPISQDEFLVDEVTKNDNDQVNQFTTIDNNSKQKTIKGDCKIQDLVRTIENRSADDKLDDLKSVIIVNSDDSIDREFEPADFDKKLNDLKLKLQKGQKIIVIQQAKPAE